MNHDLDNYPLLHVISKLLFFKKTTKDYVLENFCKKNHDFDKMCDLKKIIDEMNKYNDYLKNKFEEIKDENEKIYCDMCKKHIHKNMFLSHFTVGH